LLKNQSVWFAVFAAKKMKNITAYMVVKANGKPALTNDSGLRTKTRRTDAVNTVSYLDGLERNWLDKYKSGPHKVIEVTITPKP